jgi:16S rRNA (cytosine1407-C5)-methyltransferase
MKDVIYKLPGQFLAKLKKIYPNRFPQICSTFLQKKEQSFRINYLKVDLPSLHKLLTRERIRYKELPWPKGSFILKTELRKLQRSFIYQEGLVYIQNVSSMIPPLILGPQRGEKILDLCAAPGAKTTQIASLAGPNIELVAIEKIRTRYYKLLSNLRIQGVDFAKTYLLNGIWVRKKFPEYFDKVLLDAPCSCEGLFYVNNPHSFKYWKERKVKEMVHKQKKLIASAIYSLKEGGYLVYSTCTFSPEENEGVIDWALNKFKGQIEIVPISIPLSNVTSGLLRWEEKKFSSALRLSLRIIPNEFMEGFFIAKLKKI